MSLSRNLYLNLIKDDRYMYLVKGLGNTLLITIVAVVVGILLGFLLAYIRTTHDKTGNWKAANLIAHVYITVIRGTPMVLQLLIVYFVVFASVNVPKIIVAFIAFGLNSGAYVAEIIRAGLMSIDEGQYEAGASLGFSYTQTMLYFILPQAIKNVLPALGNEMIVLLKETSVAGYIAMDDLTRGADIIRSQTYSAFTPLLIAAAIYLFFVLIFDSLVKKLERNLKNSDH
ncbi:MAG: amino acid ABC transporter permease [Lachnospiraceae bacterium]|jgi:His/Glu/Gln/Arg/opine family amino acid ABC transporter permease subunit|nr:amino acid ABC transporter permease [Lachnospiraceae bacterium]MBQ6318938.1 amino acid ABC transporter permease [Lachnospiraceae bacterium]